MGSMVTSPPVRRPDTFERCPTHAARLRVLRTERRGGARSVRTTVPAGVDHRRATDSRMRRALHHLVGRRRSLSEPLGTWHSGHLSPNGRHQMIASASVFCASRQPTTERSMNIRSQVARLRRFQHRLRRIRDVTFETQRSRLPEPSRQIRHDVSDDRRDARHASAGLALLGIGPRAVDIDCVNPLRPHPFSGTS